MIEEGGIFAISSICKTLTFFNYGGCDIPFFYFYICVGVVCNRKDNILSTT